MKDKKQNQNRVLLISAIKKFTIGFAILGAFLFICSGDIRYWNAWLYIAVFSVSIFFFGVYLYTTDKGLLKNALTPKKRKNHKRHLT